MLLVPAIDLRGGKAVRLFEGKAESARVVAEDPVAVAESFVRAGAKRVHVVDLDGAFAGSPAHLALIGRIAAVIPGGLQVGGGLRDEKKVEAVLNAGARYAILGTMLLSDPDRFTAICARFPGQIIAGVDGVRGRVASEGWVKQHQDSILDVAQRAAKAGAAAVVSTEITRDGTGLGVDVKGASELALALSIPVFASGGVSGMSDLQSLAGTRVAGVIVGRAIYDGAIDLASALLRFGAV